MRQLRGGWECGGNNYGRREGAVVDGGVRVAGRVRATREVQRAKEKLPMVVRQGGGEG